MTCTVCGGPIHRVPGKGGPPSLAAFRAMCRSQDRPANPPVPALPAPTPEARAVRSKASEAAAQAVADAKGDVFAAALAVLGDQDTAEARAMRADIDVYQGRRTSKPGYCAGWPRGRAHHHERSERR